MPRLNKLFVLILLLAGPSVYAAGGASEERLDEVAEREARIMPFDLERTTDVFTRTETGGLQQVVAKDSTNTRQDCARPSIRGILSLSRIN